MVFVPISLRTKKGNCTVQTTINTFFKQSTDILRDAGHRDTVMIRSPDVNNLRKWIRITSTERIHIERVHCSTS
ncbi:unnamed protein product [Chondrus crispus]|uniref:Uncharacterized protein n=1 Tax=Chondrus crispus TaxID=2769 RepID=R7QSU6_CHOCR|nr:unnamed protein product [Chondrus crispus]CDF41214.1 unnamed protein product [Chondrus crispus]|eukprot:XP_005711508.1 unnamed protein product [Chondrus crispus]